MSSPSLEDRRLARACHEAASVWLDALGADGFVSMYAGGTDGSTWAWVDADRRHYAASMMKLPLLVAAYRRHARGELDLDADVPIANRFRSAAAGYYSLNFDWDQDEETWSRVGGRATLRWLAERSITRSGNLATNVLLDHVGFAEVGSVLADAGCSSGTTVLRGIEDRAARDAGLDNNVTAADLARVMAGIATGALARPEVADEVEAVLSRQHYRDGIPAGLPSGVYAANKTGWVDGVCHDVALVRPPGAPSYVLAVCVTAPAEEDRLVALVRSLSRTVWEHRR